MGDLFLIRHGQTDENHAGVLQGPRIDASLSEVGRMQAAKLANAFSKTQLDGVISSPLVRARTTADFLAAPQGLAVTIEPELYEVDYGDLSGRPHDEVAGEWERVVDAWQMGLHHVAFPGGESASVAFQRTRPFTERIRRIASAGQWAVVGHGALNQLLIAALTGAPLRDLIVPAANASITHLTVSAGKCDIARWNDVSHLAAR